MWLLMVQETDIKKRLCPECSVALLYPHSNEELAGQGWFKCIFCSYCMIIESESYKERTKNQK